MPLVLNLRVCYSDFQISTFQIFNSKHDFEEKWTWLQWRQILKDMKNLKTKLRMSHSQSYQNHSVSNTTVTTLTDSKGETIVDRFYILTWVLLCICNFQTYWVPATSRVHTKRGMSCVKTYLRMIMWRDSSSLLRGTCGHCIRCRVLFEDILT